MAIDDDLQRYGSYLRDMTKRLARLYFEDASYEAQEIPIDKARDVYGYWVAMIIVAGSGLKTTLKAHFFSSPIKQHIAQKNNIDHASLSSSHDYIKEFLNLCAGKLKMEMESNKIDVGISLPLLMSGVDELFYTASSQIVRCDKSWTLQGNGNISIIISQDTELSEASIFDKITLADPAAESADDGEMDIL